MVPEQIAIGQAWQAFDSDGNLQDTKLSERLDQFVASVLVMSEKLMTRP
jgi:FMN reductase